MLQKAMVRTSRCHVITLRGRLLRAAARQRLIVEVYRYGCSPRHRDRRERRGEFSRPFDKSGRRQVQRASRATAGSKGNRTLTGCRLRPRPVAGSGRGSMAKWLDLWTASSSPRLAGHARRLREMIWRKLTPRKRTWKLPRNVLFQGFEIAKARTDAVSRLSSFSPWDAPDAQP